MKKLILTLVTLASLTACKKDIVEPVEITDVNRLPKRIYFENIDSSKLDSSYYGNFIYNEKGLLKTFIKYYMSNKTVSLDYEYDGYNVTKIICHQKDSIIYTKTYQYENNLLKSISRSNSSTINPDYTFYNYKNGVIDYILTKSITGENIDSISVTSNQNETIFKKYELGIQYRPKSIHVFKGSNSILDSSSTIPSTYYYLNKTITLQDEVIARLGILDKVKTFNPYIDELNLYKLILSSEGINYSYNFDGHNRLTTIKEQNRLDNFDGSSQELTLYSKIIY